MSLIRFLKKTLSAFFFCFFLAEGIAAPPKVLHLTFHHGCAVEFEGVARALSLDLTTWYIPNFSPDFLDNTTTTQNALYNIGRERAERIWEKHKAYFSQFDVILTSDTAPLSRIFLQNNYNKPLIIWICNRFDYFDKESLDCDFPDAEYYQLFDEACRSNSVTVIAYNAFEHYYARSKGLNTGDLTITPCACYTSEENRDFFSLVPSNVEKKERFFLPPYHNEFFYIDLSEKCASLNIPSYRGRYNGAADLAEFKGIIHLPYAWSNLALFENIALGIPYFIPSKKFFIELAQGENYFHPELPLLIENDLFDLSEWYAPERQALFTYFDSWEELQYKIGTINYLKLNTDIKSYAQEHRIRTLNQWREVFEKIHTN